MLAFLLAAALYQSGTHLYSVSRTEGDALLMLDYDSGRLSRLRAEGDDFVAGPSIGVDEPVAVRVSIAEDAIRIETPASVAARRLDAFSTEPFAGGTLYLPRQNGRHTAVVAVPGTSMALPAPYFARRGVAVLALEHRPNWREAKFEDVARDVVAAVEELQKRPDIGMVGVYASSQGGWIAPITAANSPSIGFVVCAACPAWPMWQQELIRTGYELRADGFDARDVLQAVEYRRQLFLYLRDGTELPRLEQLDEAARGSKWYARFGGVPSREAPLVQWWRMNERLDPIRAWRSVKVPALVLFGERDTRVPPAEHAKRIAAADPRARIVIVPGVNHEGFLARTGGRDEVPRLDRIPPHAFESTIDWILARR